MYTDILHFSYEQLTVRYNKELNITLNKRLLDAKNAWGNLDELLNVHYLKLMLYDLISETKNVQALHSYAEDLTLIEFELQRLWGFEQDSNFHRFWEAPACSCPVSDNIERYPYYQIVNSKCLMHGD